MEKTLRRFTMRRSHKPQPSELYPQYAALFRRMDSDNSGELSLEEIRTALVKDEDFARATGAPTTLTRLAATAVAANIIDGADDSESVAINEFVAWLVLCNGQAQDALLEQAASAAEASGSGARDRVAYLPGHSKRAERRAAWAADETRWEAVRQMLREDVLSTTEELLARTAAVTNQAELAGLYRSQLLHTTDQVRRLVAGDTDSTDSSRAGDSRRAAPGEPALDAELLWLRKELSLTKLELAQASGARDEAEHKLRALVRETESETNEALGGI